MRPKSLASRLIPPLFFISPKDSTISLGIDRKETPPIFISIIFEVKFLTHEGGLAETFDHFQNLLKSPKYPPSPIIFSATEIGPVVISMLPNISSAISFLRAIPANIPYFLVLGTIVYTLES